MKTTDVSKFFLGIFERTYDGLHICQLLEALACLYQKQWSGVQFCTPPPKKSLKKPNQK